MIAELHAVCEELEHHPRPAIITGGADGVFASGADIAQLRERGRDDALAAINLTLFNRVRALPMPTIAAVDGYALGGGAELTYACDMRIATPRTVFGQPEPQLGIIAGAGATYRLVRLIGESLAKQVLLAGVQISARGPLSWGSCTRSWSRHNCSTRHANSPPRSYAARPSRSGCPNWPSTQPPRRTRRSTSPSRRCCSRTTKSTTAWTNS
jgi:enoyl-CoA hydratase/carnithine racemase